jgi:hypothetical protein
MWIFLNNAFLSIVSALRRRDLLVGARCAGDIERVFPRVHVSVTPKNDYRFRAFVPRTLVAEAIATQMAGIDYANFKDSAHDVADTLSTCVCGRRCFCGNSSRKVRLRRRRGRQSPHEGPWRVFGRDALVRPLSLEDFPSTRSRPQEFGGIGLQNVRKPANDL